MVVIRIIRKLQTLSRSGQLHVHHFTNGGRWAVCHHDNFVGKQNSFIDIMGNHNDGVIELRLDVHQRVLQVRTSQGIKRTERFIH